MDSIEERIRLLLYRYKTEEISVDELKELNFYLLDETYNNVIAQCFDELFFYDLSVLPAEVNAAKIYNSIITHPNFSIQPRISQSAKRKRGVPKIAAVLIVIFISAGIIYQFTDISDLFKINDTSARTHAIIPGKDQAILTSSTGEDLYLSSKHQGIALKSGKVIYENGQFLAQSPTTTFLPDQPNLLELRTPRGGQYKIELEDGTKVFLNAESKLRFPAKFGKTNRTVELEGEGYFEVYEDKNKPFLVNSQNQQIKVLGTKFNVTAYPNDQTITTTLMEGNVHVKELNTGNVKKLRPGQQLTNNLVTNDFNLQIANMETVSAWYRGYFDFSNQNIRSIMKQIARWYDVEVIYKTDVQDNLLEGSVSRVEHVDDLLHILSSTGMADFHIEGRKIIVTKPKK